MNYSKGTEWVKALDKKLNDIDNIILQEVRGTYSRDFMKRIFEQGRRAEGGKIGSYSTNPLVIAANAVTPKAQTGKLVWQPRKNKKGYYGYMYEGGYKEFRNKQGRNSSFVDLFLTGTLRQDLNNGFIKKGNRIVLPVSLKKYPTSKGKKKRTMNNAEKLGYLEDKYGDDVFTYGKVPLKALRKRIGRSVAKLLNNA